MHRTSNIQFLSRVALVLGVLFAGVAGQAVGIYETGLRARKRLFSWPVIAALLLLWPLSAFGQPPGHSVDEAISPLEIIHATAADDHVTTAVVRRPPGPGPFPAAVLLHGGTSEWTLDKLKEAALETPTHVRLLEEGYVVVTCTRRSWQEGAPTTGPSSDCLAVVNAVKKLPGVDPRSVVVFGGSGGGYLALELAAETDLCAIAAGAPATILWLMDNATKNSGTVEEDPMGNLDERSRKSKEHRVPLLENPLKYYTPERQAFTREKFRRIRCPIFIAQGDQDSLKKTNLELLIPELRAVGKDVQVIIYPGERHGFYYGRHDAEGRGGGHYEQFFSDLTAFFAKHVPTKPIPLKKPKPPEK